MQVSYQSETLNCTTQATLARKWLQLHEGTIGERDEDVFVCVSNMFIAGVGTRVCQKVGCELSCQEVLRSTLLLECTHMDNAGY